MTMPIDLVLVRHGESEGNLARRLSRRGDNKHFTKEFRERHSSRWRLTDRGIEQARAAGTWIGENIPAYKLPPALGTKRFDRHYTSEYVRAMETAAYLDSPDTIWFPEFYLRERDWGAFDTCTEDEKQKLFGDMLRRRDVEPLYWTPPGGVPMADLCLRIDRMLDTLHRECEGMRVIIVCHGEVMWAFRVRLERISQDLYTQLHLSRDPKVKIHNCQILHYTRNYPTTDLTIPTFGWMRSICPWDLSRSSNEWQEIIRPRYTGKELLARVRKTPRLVK